jgi:hypothetical protein
MGYAKRGLFSSVYAVAPGPGRAALLSARLLKRRRSTTAAPLTPAARPARPVSGMVCVRCVCAVRQALCRGSTGLAGVPTRRASQGCCSTRWGVTSCSKAAALTIAARRCGYVVCVVVCVRWGGCRTHLHPLLDAAVEPHEELKARRAVQHYLQLRPGRLCTHGLQLLHRITTPFARLSIR